MKTEAINGNVMDVFKEGVRSVIDATAQLEKMRGAIRSLEDTMDGSVSAPAADQVKLKRLAKSKAGQAFYDFVYTSVNHKELARGLTDFILLLPGADAILLSWDEAMSNLTRVADSKISLLERLKLETDFAPDGLHGKLFVPAGITPGEIIAAINQESQSRWKRYAIYPVIALSDDEMNAAQAEDKSYEFFIGNDSLRKTKSEQKLYLENKKMDFAEPWVLIVSAGKFRLEHGGFPKRASVGTSDDPGDLFGGKMVRVHDGVVVSYEDGINCHTDHSIDEFANTVISAAGSVAESRQSGCN